MLVFWLCCKVVFAPWYKKLKICWDDFSPVCWHSLSQHQSKRRTWWSNMFFLQWKSTAILRTFNFWFVKTVLLFATTRCQRHWVVAHNSGNQLWCQTLFIILLQKSVERSFRWDSMSRDGVCSTLTCFHTVLTSVCVKRAWEELIARHAVKDYLWCSF